MHLEFLEWNNDVEVEYIMHLDTYMHHQLCR